MKVAFLTASVSRLAGGLQNSVRRLAQTLTHCGALDVSVLALRDRFSEADLGSWSPISPSVFPVRGPRVFGYAPELSRALVRDGYDLLHPQGLWMYPSVACRNWSRRTEKPYLITPRGMLDPWALNHSRWKKRIAAWLYEDAHLRGAACLHALCEPEARAIRAYGLRNPVCVIPNGVDLPEIGDAERLKTEKRKQGITDVSSSEPVSVSACQHFTVLRVASEGRKVLLYLGRLHPKKNLPALLRAWKATLNSQPSTLNSWCLAIAGWDQGGHEAELKRLASELEIPWADTRGNAENLKTEMPNDETGRKAFSVSAFQRFSILFLGPQFGVDKEAAYRNCDAFILPSFSEGLPMVVLEAWAYGKPVLMTPECNLPEGFAAGAALRIAPSAQSIAHGLRELFQSSISDLQATGSRGRALAATRFTWPGIAREIRAVYEWVLGGGPKPGCVAVG